MTKNNRNVTSEPSPALPKSSPRPVTNVKNDDQLVKVAAIVQRLVSAQSKGGSEDEYGLSEAEKQQLLDAVGEAAQEAQTVSDQIQSYSQSMDN